MIRIDVHANLEENVIDDGLVGCLQSTVKDFQTQKHL